MPDAITILKQDHTRLRKLLTALMSTDDEDDLEQIVEDVMLAVTAHTRIEEELFYPAFREAVRGESDETLFFEALEEHHVVSLVLPELEEEEPGSHTFLAKAKVLGDLLAHHLEEEEEELFPKAQKALSTKALADLGQALERRRRELLGGAPEPGAEPAATQGEKTARGGEAGRGAKLDLNKAGAEELQRIDGIDVTRARRIIDHRKAHGPFHEWSELGEVQGISDALVRKLQKAGTLG